MAGTRTRPRREHRDIAQEAGIGPVSLVSIVAGVLCGYGAFSLIAALVGAILSGADVDTEFRTNDWTGSGAVALLASAVVLLVAYLFGGYVSGRMARRAGLLHGLAVALVSLVLGGVIGAVVSGLTDDQDVERNLRSIGVPTTGDQVTEVAVVGLLASLIAIIVGAALGGIMGERWHTRLARRAADPSIGPAAESRARAEREDHERDRRVERDEAVRRDVDVDGRRDRDDEAGDGRHRSDNVDVTDHERDRSSQGDPSVQRRRPDHDDAAPVGPTGDEPRDTATEWTERQSGRSR